MRSSDPLYPIRHLIGETGFPSKEDLGSFCLSVGLFHGKRIGTKTKPPRSWDPLLFGTGPMLEVIAYTMEPSIKDRVGIRDLLYEYYLGGVEMIVEKISGMTQMEALRSISGFIPP